MCSRSSRARKSSQSELSCTVVTPLARASAMATVRALCGAVLGWRRNLLCDEGARGAFAEDAGGLPEASRSILPPEGSGVAAVMSAAESGGVGDGHVAVDAAEEGGMAGGDVVEVRRVGRSLCQPVGVVPASALDPCVGFGGAT